MVSQTDIDRKPRFRSDGTVNNPKGYETADIGKLIYFRNYLTTFPDRQKSLENRYKSEKVDALAIA